MKFQMATNIIVIFLSTLFSNCDDSTSVKRDLKQRITLLAQEAHIPTLSVYVKSSTMQLDFRYKDINERINAISCYGIASTTKLLSTLIILKLVEENKISLNDPINKFIDHADFPIISWFDSITVRHLLNHTSGIPEYTKNSAWINAVMSATPPSNYLEKVVLIPYDTAFKFQHYGYSNSNFVVLERIVEVVNNKNARHIFNDFYTGLGLLDISFKKEDKNSQSFFAQQENDINNVSAWEENYGFEGGAFATTADLAKILRMVFIEKSVLNEKSLNDLSSWTDLGKYKIDYGFAQTTEYGLGLMKFEFNGRLFVGHAGSSLKYQSFAFIEPATGAEIVLQTNCSGKHYNEAFFKKILGEIVKEIR
jgi:D-alanyl-D-alanine carboxypeptidase